MSSFQSTSKNSTAAKLKSKKGSDEGKIYEKLLLTLIAKNGYELSKDNNSIFYMCDFAIGREIGIGEFDDVVCRHTYKNNTRNFVFIQIKHKQDKHDINSEILSAEASSSKGGNDGGMPRDFNLEKYFTAYLSVKEELKSTNSVEFENGQIKYVAIFTNIGLDEADLNSKGFSLKEAPDDVTNLLTLRRTQSRAQYSSQCYQLCGISEDLHKSLKKNSDLHRVARELAKYVVWKNHRDNKIFGTDETPIKHYHAFLEKEVIEISSQVKYRPPEKPNKGTKSYFDAQFRHNFIYCDKNGPKQELRDALLEAVRDLGKSDEDRNDDNLKKMLSTAKFRVVANFGRTEKEKLNFPDKWRTIENSDIDEFLKCLVLSVNQPNVNDLLADMYSVKETFLHGTPVGNAVDNMVPKIRDRLEKEFGIYKKNSYKGNWLSGEKISEFVQEQQEAVNISVMTLLYEDSVMQYGTFNKLDEIAATLDIFLNFERIEEIGEQHLKLENIKVLCVRASMTLLSSIQILQYLNAKKDQEASFGHISTEMSDFKCKEIRDRVAKAFRSESYNLLTIECRETVDEPVAKEFYDIFHDIIVSSSDKKIIIITKENEPDALADIFESRCDTKFYYEITDYINVKDFVPVEEPLEKQIIVFQGQKRKVSLAELTGITSWSLFLDYLLQRNFQIESDIIYDMITLLLTGDKIEIGSKPLGTSSLEGAYATLVEEINVKSFTNKLLSLESNDNTESSEDLFAVLFSTQINTETIDHKSLSQGSCNINNTIYIVSGILGLNETEKTEKLIQLLGLVNDKEKIKNQIGSIRSESKIRIADVKFKKNNFKQICHNNPDKQVFWVCVKCEQNAVKFILQMIYNPKFYVKRKFKQVIFKKEVRELLIKECLSARFVLHCVENQQQLINSMKFSNVREEACFQNNLKNGSIKIFTENDNANAAFQDICRTNEGNAVHLLKVKGEQIIWCNSHGSVDELRKYVDHEQCQVCLTEDDDFIKEIKENKVVIIADEPGMGKSTSLTKLYETGDQIDAFVRTHCVIRMNLKDQLQAFRDMEFNNGYTDIANVVDFLSNGDSKLNHILAKILLEIALDKSEKFSKPLLLALDGFDEVLDIEVRKKIISLLKFLKNETACKLWITTRLHFRDFLQNELCTFAFEFYPLNDELKFEFIRKYLENRLCLILNEDVLLNFFGYRDDMQENKSIHKFTETFFGRMKSVFKKNMSNFIGTPLQLYLLLEGSVEYLKNWLENDLDPNLNSNFLGADVLEVFERFIRSKYVAYFKKVGNKEGDRQEYDIFNFNCYNENLAISSISGIEPHKCKRNFRNIALSAGIVKSNGTNTEFIHTSFRDYFAAKVFIDWTEKEQLTSSELEYLSKILKKPDFELTRLFINLMLEKMAKTENYEGNHNNFKKIAESFLTEQSPLINIRGVILTGKERTMMHYAIEEDNRYIIRFLLNSLFEDTDILKKFLFNPLYLGFNIIGNVLHLACKVDQGDAEMVKILLDAAAAISEDVLQEFLYSSDALCDSSDTCPRNALCVAVEYKHNIRILVELLRRANNKLDLIQREGKASAFIAACLCGKDKFLDFFLQEFQHDKDSVKKLLYFNQYGGNCLSWATHNKLIFAKLLSVVKSMNDNGETLKNMLIHEESGFSFLTAVRHGKIDVVEMLLNSARDINDDYHTLRQLIFSDKGERDALTVASKIGHSDIFNLLYKEQLCLLRVGMLEAVDKNEKM